MSRLWTPPSVDRRLADKTREYTASLESMVDRVKGVMDDFNRELKRIDPYLELIFIKPTPEAGQLLGAVPGRYHVLKHTPGAPPTLIPIVGPNGEFVEPDSGLFNWLARHDMWSSQAKHERERIAREGERAAQKKREQETEERQQELLERYKAAFETSVSMNRSTPWAQNVAGAKRAYRKKAA